MKNDLDKKLQQAVADVKRKEKIVVHLKQLDRLLKERNAELKKLDSLLRKEKEDYDQISKGGLRSAFYHMLGTLDDAIDKERQEYLMAFLKHERCEEVIKQLKDEKELLENILSSLFLAEKELENLMERKKIAIPLNDPKLKEKLAAIDQKIFAHFAKKREIKEAITAGKRAKKQLEKIKEDLVQVKSWGSADISTLGTRSVRKKKYIDRAQSDANKADALLFRFQKELHDISKQYKVAYRLEIHLLHDFLYQYFNNLIIDWVLKKKIKNTILGINQTMDGVDMILITLEHEIEKIKNFIAEEKEAKKLLMMSC